MVMRVLLTLIKDRATSDEGRLWIQCAVLALVILIIASMLGWVMLFSALITLWGGFPLELFGPLTMVILWFVITLSLKAAVLDLQLSGLKDGDREKQKR